MAGHVRTSRGQTQSQALESLPPLPLQHWLCPCAVFYHQPWALAPSWNCGQSTGHVHNAAPSPWKGTCYASLRKTTKIPRISSYDPPRTTGVLGMIQAGLHKTVHHGLVVPGGGGCLGNCGTKTSPKLLLLRGMVFACFTNASALSPLAHIPRQNPPWP